jgi:hypothetical protein
MGGVIKDNRVGGVLMPTMSAEALLAPPPPCGLITIK